jgi:hypothetical protein
MARRAAWFLLLGAGCDLLENWLALITVREGWFNQWDEPPGLIAFLLGVMTLVKLLGVGLAIGAIVVVGLGLARNAADADTPWQGFRAGVQAVIAVRMQLIVVALLAVALLLHEQVPDVIRRWAQEPGPPIAALAFTFLLAVGIWHSSRWMLAAADATPGPTVGRDRLLAAGAIVVVVGIGVPQRWWPGSRVIFLALVVAIAWLMNRGVQNLAVPPQPPGWGKRMWPSVLAAPRWRWWRWRSCAPLPATSSIPGCSGKHCGDPAGCLSSRSCC